MKRIIFPCSSRVHLARQKLLIEKLRREYEVDVWQVSTEFRDMESFAIFTAIEFKNYIAGKKYDLALIRADRFELLLIAGICAYRGIKIAHIEGGADSGAGVIDTRVRNSISQLADLHFVTDNSARRMVAHLTGSSDVFNVGSLDVSFARHVIQDALPSYSGGDYILLLHHAIPGEGTELVRQAVEELGMDIVGVKGNSDYKKSLMSEEYSPEDFISLVYNAKLMVGNSSAICKEASILGTPCVLTGKRQDGRLTGRNVMRAAHVKSDILRMCGFQIEMGRYEPDDIYYKKDTEEKILAILKDFI